MMALARYAPFGRRQADRLFGSVVRYWVKSERSGEVVSIMFACGCHLSERAQRPRHLCWRHRYRGAP